MSQANTMNPKRMNPTPTPKHTHRAGSSKHPVVSRCVIQPKPSKHNGMLDDEVYFAPAPARARLNKRKQEQAKRGGGGTVRAKMVGFAAAMFGMGQSLR